MVVGQSDSWQILLNFGPTRIAADGRRFDRHRSGQPELKYRFRRQVDLLALGCGLYSCARTRSYARSNGCTFSSAGEAR
jgi:hypothetical protein